MPDGRVPEPGGWNRFEIEVDDLDATVEALRQAGVTFRNEIVNGIGGRQILVEDPPAIRWSSSSRIGDPHDLNAVSSRRVLFAAASIAYAQTTVHVACCRLPANKQSAHAAKAGGRGGLESA